MKGNRLYVPVREHVSAVVVIDREVSGPICSEVRIYPGHIPSLGESIPDTTFDGIAADFYRTWVEDMIQ